MPQVVPVTAKFAQLSHLESSAAKTEFGFLNIDNCTKNFTVSTFVTD